MSHAWLSTSIYIKPFIDNYAYKTGSVFTANETYIKVRNIKAYIWFIMDTARRSIIGYLISYNHSVCSDIYPNWQKTLN